MGTTVQSAVQARLNDFAAIRQGDRAILTRQISEEDVDAFARLSGDYNPLHMDADYARKTHLKQRVVHGMLVASYVSTLIGMQLPGVGSLWMQQSFRWRTPVFIGDTLEITLTVVHKSEGSRILSIEVNAMNQNGKVVMEGEGTVTVPEIRQSIRETPIAGRVAFISGASRGIGAAIARALGAAGASVIVNYRSSSAAAEDVCHSIVSSGGNAIAARADVHDSQSLTAAMVHGTEHFGQPIGILINCAGESISPKPFLEASWGDLQQVLDSQLRGVFQCCQAAIPGMLQEKSGCIVNIGSILTWNVPPAQWSAFVMAKAALKSLTRSLAAEFGPSGVRVNMISPGTVETEATLQIPERLRKLQAMQTPLRRLAVPEDIARTALFLCTDASQFITGADIPVCGGVGM